MATKKWAKKPGTKTTSKGKKVKAASVYGSEDPKKIIDLTKPKTDKHATEFGKCITEWIQKYCNASQIPLFIELAKSKQLLDMYFLNYQKMRDILGDHIIIFERILRDSISNAIVPYVESALKKGVYPGHWAPTAIFSLCRSMIRIVMPIDKPDLGYYLYIPPVGTEADTVTVSDLENLPAMQCMRYQDYNPNRLYQFGMIVEECLMSIIAKEIELNVPFAKLASASEPLELRYAREAAEYMAPSIETWSKECWFNSNMSLDSKLRKLSDCMGQPLLTYCVRVLQQCGFSGPAVQNMLECSDLHVFYDPNAIQRIEDIASHTTGLSITLSYKMELIKERPIQIPSVRLDLKMNDLYNLVVNQYTPAPIKTAIGKKIARAIDDLTRYTLVVALATPQIKKYEDQYEEQKSDDVAPTEVVDPDNPETTICPDIEISDPAET